MNDTSEAIDYTMTKYVAADSTGLIVCNGHVPRFMLDVQVPPEGGSIVVGTGETATDYVREGEIISRPPNPATLDGMTLKNLPVPCTITVEGTAHTCTDDHCELEFTQPGAYDVIVSAFPARDATFEVTQS
jgi:hypothetical protein